MLHLKWNCNSWLLTHCLKCWMKVVIAEIREAFKKKNKKCGFFPHWGGGQPQIHTFLKVWVREVWKKSTLFIFFLKASLKFDHFHFKISKVTSFLMYVVHSKLFWATLNLEPTQNKVNLVELSSNGSYSVQ